MASPLPPTSGSMRSSTPSIIDINRRLSCGELAQDILDDVVDFIIGEDMFDPLLATQCIVLLADHGARIATDQPGCPLESLIRRPTRARPGLLWDLVLHLAGKTGELPFHVLAKHFPMQLSENMLTNTDVRTCLRARDSMGRTVSHWLWDVDSAMAREIRDARATAQAAGRIGAADRDVTSWLSSVRNAWVVQEQLLEMGVGMELPDKHGCTAMDLCIERINAGEAVLRSEFHSSNQVQACQSSRDMQEKTTTPSGPPPPAPGMRF